MKPYQAFTRSARKLIPSPRRAHEIEVIELIKFLILSAPVVYIRSMRSAVCSKAAQEIVTVFTNVDVLIVFFNPEMFAAGNWRSTINARQNFECTEAVT